MKTSQSTLVMRNLSHASMIQREGAAWVELSKTDAARAKGRTFLTRQELGL